MFGEKKKRQASRRTAADGAGGEGSACAGCDETRSSPESVPTPPAHSTPDRWTHRLCRALSASAARRPHVMRRGGAQRVADLRGAGGGHLQGQACQVWAQPRPAETGSRAGALLVRPHRRKGSGACGPERGLPGLWDRTAAWRSTPLVWRGRCRGSPRQADSAGAGGHFIRAHGGSLSARQTDRKCWWERGTGTADTWELAFTHPRSHTHSHTGKYRSKHAFRQEHTHPQSHTHS